MKSTAKLTPLTRRSLELMSPVIQALKSAAPDADPELIGGICADLLDLWETGQTLDHNLKKLSKLKFPRDQAELRRILVWVEAVQIELGKYWIAELRKDLPKLLRALPNIDEGPPPQRKRNIRRQ